MLTTAVSTAAELYKAGGNKSDIEKLGVTVAEVYNKTRSTAYHGGEISDVPTAIAYCMKKLDRRGDHRLGKVIVSGAGALVGTFVAGPVGTAVGAGAGLVTTRSYRAIKAAYKIAQGTRGVHRKAAATALMEAVYAEGVNMEGVDFKAALRALVILMGTDFLLEVDAKVNGAVSEAGDRSKLPGYIKEVAAALSSW